MPRLVKPNIRYEHSFKEALKEFNKDRMVNNEPKLKDIQDFQEYLKKLREHEKGINLPQGYVPYTHFWLVDGDKYIGKLSIRHKLTLSLKRRGGHIGYAIRPSERGKGYGSLILKLGVKKAEQLGIKNILVTCDVSNIASKRIIEKNGGKLVKNDKIVSSGALRFWIKPDKIDRNLNK